MLVAPKLRIRRSESLPRQPHCCVRPFTQRDPSPQWVTLELAQPRPSPVLAPLTTATRPKGRSRLDSEHFRCCPRTWRPLRDTLSARRTKRTAMLGTKRGEPAPMSDMRRREFIALIGGAVAAWPLAARAQQPVKPARIGYLSASSAPDANMDIFRQGMGAVGYVEGRDFVLEARFAHRDYSRFPALVEELLSTKVVLIVLGGPASRAAPFAEKSVPVVFGFSG